MVGTCSMQPFLSSAAPSLRGKAIQRGVTIDLSGVEPRRRIARPVRRVRIGLRLQAQRVILAVNAAVFADHGAVDTTFVQFYPTLKPIAKQKGTLEAAYQKEQAGR